MSSTYLIDASCNMYLIIDPGGLQAEAPEAGSCPWGDNGLTGLGTLPRHGHRRWQMTVATIGTMSALLWYWREMARFYETRRDGQ